MFRTLIEVDEFKAHIGDPGWTIVDARHAPIGGDANLGRTQYVAGHLPGAFYADVDVELCGPRSGTNGRHPLPDPQTFASFLRSFGVNGDSQIVVYDAGADMWAARFWFLCRWIGHSAVAVLNGGIRAWTEQGAAFEQGLPMLPARGTIEPHVDDRIVVRADEVLALLGTGSMTVLDARAADRFAGENETIDPVAGHIPGARNRFFKLNFGDDGRFLAPDVLRDAFALHDAQPEWIVHQCGSGITAAVNLLAMESAGLENSRLYAGSWSEWVADPKRPIERGQS